MSVKEPTGLAKLATAVEKIAQEMSKAEEKVALH